jgi:hypothetical protein
MISSIGSKVAPATVSKVVEKLNFIVLHTLYVIREREKIMKVRLRLRIRIRIRIRIRKEEREQTN